MIEVEVHARQNKIEMLIKTDKVNKFTLEPDKAMDLGINLLRAVYSTKTQESTKRSVMN